MADEKRPLIYTILLIILPILAITGLVTSSWLWYRALKPESVEIGDIIPFQVSPDAFSRGLEANLAAVLAERGITDEMISSSEPDSSQTGINSVYRIRVPRDASLRLFNVLVTDMVHDMGGEVITGTENETGTTLTLQVGTGRRATDIIVFQKSSRVTIRSGRIAIIIDDLGNGSRSLNERLFALGQTVTLSILPFQPLTRDVVRLCRETGTPYMLHMPMEPQSTGTNPGEGAITTADPDDVVREKLDRALASVPGAPGLNNHMGSKATEDIRIMEAVMAYALDKGLYFVDSQTSRQSQGYPISQRTGVKSAKLTSYLDVEEDPEFIAQRLDELAERAFAGETVVAIGHVRPNTVAVLEDKLPELEADGIIFIRAADVVR